ncbi:MAG: baseplate J/gp47 family protein [Pseudomonadota bacterium]
MPFNRPSLSEIRAQIIADIDADLPGADSRLRHSNLGVIATMLTGATHGLYGYLDSIVDQLLPDTSTGIYLERLAATWGMTRQPATAATGTVTITGTDGASVPSGAELRRADGVVYLTTGSSVIALGGTSLPVTAQDVGSLGNAPDGAALAFVSPLAGVDVQATAGALLGGGDRESDASLRDRYLTRKRQPPHGGAEHDYVAWALDRDAHGVRSTRAWVGRHEMGVGFVTVRFMMDDDTPDGIPAQGDVDTVAAYILQEGPVGAQIFTVAPVAAPLDVSLQVSPLTAEVQDAIRAAIADLIRREAVPGGTILISHLREAISTAPGEFDHVVTSPVANVVASAPGEIATVGTITITAL